MTDDNNPRFRPSDLFAREPSSNVPANDPLAELARLIGRTDPFAERARAAREDAQPGDAQPYDAERYDAERYEEPRVERHDSDARYGREDGSRSNSDWPGAPAPRAHDDPYAESVRRGLQGYDDGYADQDQSGADDLPPGYDPVTKRPRDLPGFAFPDPPSSSQPAAASYAAQRSPAYDEQDSPPYAADDAPSFAIRDVPGFATRPSPDTDDGLLHMSPEHDDEFYDDAPQGSGRRKGMLTVIAVLGLAVIGTAGAFGYRTLFAAPKAPLAPPVIRASSEPSKVAPPPSSSDTSKLTYDRFADRTQDEQVVVREEKPVETREIARSGSRVVLPGGPFTSSTGTVTSSTGAATAPTNPSPSPNSPPQRSSGAAQSSPAALGEPKRVRTLQIRPDQPDGGARPQEVSSLQGQGVTPMTADAPEPPPGAPGRVRASGASRAAAMPPQPSAGANAPLSLSPESADASQGRSSLRVPPSLANTPTAPQAQGQLPPPPTRIASAPATGNGGSYLVQVSSQRSEADAQAAYRSLRTRYTSVLGDRQAVIRRADLGSKGVFYRAMIGPFGSREEAIQLCGNLKAAGGDCVVQGN